MQLNFYPPFSMIVLEVEALATTTATIAWHITYHIHTPFSHWSFPTKAWKQLTENSNHNPHHTLQIQTVTPQFLFSYNFQLQKKT